MSEESMSARKKRLKKIHMIDSDMSRMCKFFDSLFTLAAVAYIGMGIFWFVEGDVDKGIARWTLGIAFWIASTQLQPYWDRYCPTRCRHQPENPENL